MRRRYLVLTALIVAVVSLWVAPMIAYLPDLRGYWLPWQAEMAKLRPWKAYALPECNYPPVVLYLLAITEAVRKLLDATPKSATNCVLIKLPNIVAHLVGGACLFFSLRSSIGKRTAAALGAAWLLSLSMFVNAAVWAQWDGLLALWMLLFMLAMRQKRSFIAGIWVGVALATKAQAIFVLPVLGVYVIARRDVKALWRGAAGMMLALVVIFGPIARHGRLPEAIAAYTGSVDMFPRRTVNAWNVWELVDIVESRVVDSARLDLIRDNRPVLPSVSESFTSKRLGIVLFGAYVVAMLVIVARRRIFADVLVGVPLCGVAMFMLATQMHERYIVPPAALMTLWLVLPTRYRIQFIYWTVSGAVNEIFTMARFGFLGKPLRQIAIVDVVPGTLSVFNVIMFGWLTWMFFSPRFADDTKRAETEPAQPAELLAADVIATPS